MTLVLIVLLVAYGLNVAVGAAVSSADATGVQKVVDAPTVALIPAGRTPVALIPAGRTPGAAAWIATGRDPNAQRAIINSSGANGFAAPPVQVQRTRYP